MNHNLVGDRSPEMRRCLEVSSCAAHSEHNQVSTTLRCRVQNALRDVTVFDDCFWPAPRFCVGGNKPMKFMQDIGYGRLVRVALRIRLA